VRRLTFLGSLTETQSAADLARIRAMESGLLEQPEVRQDRSLQRAIARHKSVIDRCYYYLAFTDAVKGGALGEASGLLFESPAGFRHIATESLVQAPAILAKAMRGGYARSYASTFRRLEYYGIPRARDQACSYCKSNISYTIVWA
jgi:hypothetical protein